MINSNGQAQIEAQLALSAGSRKNLYVIAKWLNFLTLVLSILGGVAIWWEGYYLAWIAIPFVSVVICFYFWLSVRKVISTVGNMGGTSSRNFNSILDDKYKNIECNHIVLGIFNLLFCNWISGILILVASSSFNHSQTLRVLSMAHSSQSNL